MSAHSSQLPRAEAKDVHLVGARPGNVKALAGFRKGFHKVPAALPDHFYERQFDTAICAADLDRDARDLFERLRVARGYKRKEISLAVDPPNATITTTDFILDLGYELDLARPDDYRRAVDLHDIREIAVFSDPQLNDALRDLFSRVSFTFAEPVKIEDVIDEVEADASGDAKVAYPPDYAECTIKLRGFVGEVRVTPRELEVVTGPGSSPAELVKTFVKASDVLAANPSLEKLIPRRRE
ncbi:MAG: hypothetical protein JO295_00710 [Verrucomicrobia bacterium]|nr:hypothetical protein [Verrucomicrobiota bacterium]